MFPFLSLFPRHNFRLLSKHRLVTSVSGNRLFLRIGLPLMIVMKSVFAVCVIAQYLRGNIQVISCTALQSASPESTASSETVRRRNRPYFGASIFPPRSG